METIDKLHEALRIAQESYANLEGKLAETSKQLESLRGEYDDYVKKNQIKDSFLEHGGKKEAVEMMTKLVADKVTLEDGKLAGDLKKLWSEMKSDSLTAVGFYPENPNVGSGSNPTSSSNAEKISMTADLMKISDHVERMSKARELGLANSK